MITKYLIILVTFMPVTLSFEIKIRKMSLYGSVSVIIIIMLSFILIVQIANCKLEGWHKLHSCLYMYVLIISPICTNYKL